ncbi:MAG: SDR family NAD(P)-dependent oxidoreductase [Acidimicrobiales bacterium]
MTEFRGRYGRWALVAGASEGVGLAFAHAVAEGGLSVALVSRRPSVLEEVAQDLRSKWPVDTRTLAIDLSEISAAEAIADMTEDLDVGLLVYCAGADPRFVDFLDAPVEAAEAMVRRNCLVPMQLCHRFARPMVERGRGGIILVSSGAGLVGARRMVAYGASKAFDTVMGEALWAELHQRGVDVLSLVLGVTDTPALRRLLADRGNLADANDGTPIPGAATPEAVVAEALAHLRDGPTWFVGELLREGSKALGGMARGDAARVMFAAGAGVMDQKLS